LIPSSICSLLNRRPIASSYRRYRHWQLAPLSIDCSNKA
jgi:hypothetical protein